MKRPLRAPSPAFVISLVALFVALGGTTYAATSLPANSVGAKQLKKNAVTSPKIKNGAVTAAKINVAGLTVPVAAHATSADTATSATSATSATNATSATHAGTADHATNSDQLAGAAASAYQRRVTGTCSTGVTAVDQTGGVTCAPRTVVPIDMSLADGDIEGLGVGGLGIRFDCQSLFNNKDVRFFNLNASQANATLNWFYFEGAVNAGGTVVGYNNGQAVNFTGQRVEGQFIFSVHNQEEVTVNLHAIDLGSSCEYTGTAEYAPE